MHGRGIFANRMFGNQGLFGGAVPTELDPSRPRMISPSPGQPVVVGSAVPVQSHAMAFDPVTQMARNTIGVRAPNFRPGAIYMPGRSVPVTAVRAAFPAVQQVAQSVIPVGPQRQTFEGFGNTDGLGGLIGFGGR